MRASGASTLPISGRQLALALIRLVLIGAVVVLAVVEIPGLGAIRARLGGADIGWMALAAALELGSVFAFVLALHATFARRLELRLSCALGVTAQAVNALAPAGGTTGVAAAGLLLRRSGLAAELVTARSVGLFVLTGVAANVLLIVVGGLGAATGVLPSGLSLWVSLAPALAAVVLLTLVGALARLLPAELRPGQGRWRAWVSWALLRLHEGLVWSTQMARVRDPLLLLGALGFVVLDLGALIAAFHATGGAVPPIATVMLAYALGQAGSLVSLPGATAGGMVGVFALYHVSVAPATAAVLLYQVVASLIPLGLGLIGAPAAVRWTAPGAAGRPYALSGSAGSAPS